MSKNKPHNYPDCPVCDFSCPYLTDNGRCSMEGGPEGECDDYDYYTMDEDEDE